MHVCEPPTYVHTHISQTNQIKMRVCIHILYKHIWWCCIMFECHYDVGRESLILTPGPELLLLCDIISPKCRCPRSCPWHTPISALTLSSFCGSALMRHCLNEPHRGNSRLTQQMSAWLCPYNTPIPFFSILLIPLSLSLSENMLSLLSVFLNLSL